MFNTYLRLRHIAMNFYNDIKILEIHILLNIHSLKLHN